MSIEKAFLAGRCESKDDHRAKKFRIVTCLWHMPSAYSFTPVDRAGSPAVSHGKFTSWLSKVSAVLGEISVKRASPLHM